MTKDKAALKLALEALMKLPQLAWTLESADRNLGAILAIKEALAPTSTQCEVQLEQEPVCEITVKNGHWIDTNGFSGVKDLANGIHKLYTTPPKRPWVGLTDEEMQALWDRYAHMEMMRAIEAKLKELNI